MKCFSNKISIFFILHITVTCILTLLLLFSNFEYRIPILSQIIKFSETPKSEKNQTRCPRIPEHLKGQIIVTLDRPYIGFLKDFRKCRSVTWPPSLYDLSEIYGQHIAEHSVFQPKCGRPFFKSTIGIIIAYRDRSEQLRLYLTYMLPILIRQELSFKIYVIEQTSNSIFNRAKLFNVGFDIIDREREREKINFDCIIFTDVDIIIENDHNLFRCDPLNRPRHYAAYLDKFSYELSYPKYVGGVIQITPKKFKYINGFSNKFWGWGGEDDDFYNRLVTFGKFKISRPKKSIGRAKMIRHEHEEENPPNSERIELLKNWSDRRSIDGLFDLEYRILERADLRIFEKILVDIVVK